MDFLTNIAAEVIAAVLAAGVVAVLGGLAAWLFRRRRVDPSPTDETPPSLPGKGAGGLGWGARGSGGEPGPLRVLVAASRPWDAEPWLDTEAEWETLCAALQPGAGAEQVPIHLEFFPSATQQALRAALQQGCDVLHFTGHGTADPPRLAWRRTWPRKRR